MIKQKYEKLNAENSHSLFLKNSQPSFHLCMNINTLLKNVRSVSYNYTSYKDRDFIAFVFVRVYET